MTSTFLTKEEVAEMTGRVQRAAQTRELTHMGVIHKLRADGSVLVLRAHVEQLLGYQAGTKAKEPDFEPNWAAAAPPERAVPKRKQ
jgi:hypothetical protein